MKAGRKIKKSPNLGSLLVITGLSGSGKDIIGNHLLSHPDLVQMGISKVVTHADRPPREGEIHGKDYFFVERGVIEAMHANGELVEDPVLTGTSKKATSKKELLRVMQGDRLIWRIEVSRAMEVASGDFFDRLFEKNEAEILKSRTTVVLLDTPKNQLERRRKEREKERYSEEEFRLRDIQDEPYIKKLRKLAVVIQNFDNQLEKAISEVVDLTIKHFSKKYTF